MWREIQDITVLKSYLSFLTYYRKWRGFSSSPSKGEQTIFGKKISGPDGLTNP